MTHEEEDRIRQIVREEVSRIFSGIATNVAAIRASSPSSDPEWPFGSENTAITDTVESIAEAIRDGISQEQNHA